MEPNDLELVERELKALLPEQELRQAELIQSILL